MDYAYIAEDPELITQIVTKHYLGDTPARSADSNLFSNVNKYNFLM